MTIEIWVDQLLSFPHSCSYLINLSTVKSYILHSWIFLDFT